METHRAFEASRLPPVGRVYVTGFHYFLQKVK